MSRLTNLVMALGFVVLMPDYVGLGESELQHPYCHAQSESDAGWQDRQVDLREFGSN